jgi:hypothetical protein
MFNGKLSGHDGDRLECEVDGFTVVAVTERDDDSRVPWEDCGHGPVSEWTTRDKRPGERVLCTDGRSKRFYDFADAIKTAKADGWDAKPYGGTAGQRAARAVEADFRNLQAWCNDQWWYVGVCVRVYKNEIPLTGKYEHALWGIESNSGEYLVDTANELLGEAVDAAKKTLATLCDCEAA